MNEVTEHNRIEEFIHLLKEHGITGSVHFEREMDRGFDAVFRANKGFSIYIEYKTRLYAATAAKWVLSAAYMLGKPDCYLVMISDEIQPGVTKILGEQNLFYYSPNGPSFLKLPGFTYIVKSLPAAAAKKRYASVGTIFVGKGSRICRILLSHPGKVWKQRELAESAQLSPGYTSLLVRKMKEESYLAENSRGLFSVQDPDFLLDEWVRIYRFDRFEAKQGYAFTMKNLLEGMKNLSAKLNQAKITHAYAGGTGAVLRAPYMEPDTIMAYVSKLPESLPGLYPVESKGNVLLYVPADEGRFQEGNSVEELPVVSDVQLYLDLKKMPGRAEDQAEYLREQRLNWRKENG